jgi:hypothetical protein
MNPSQLAAATNETTPYQTSRRVVTFSATIHIGGSVERIRDVCRAFCLRGLCVTVTPTEYIYTGGSESGAAVGLINYPRFPSEPERIRATAKELAAVLMSECCQRSCSVVCSDETEYLENKDIVIPR